jgi:hypothetical protein
LPVTNPGSVLAYKIYDNSDTLVASTASLTYTVTGLTNGTSYTYKVAAANSNGDESAKVSVTATPSTPVSAVTISTVTTADVSALTADVVYESADSVLFVKKEATPSDYSSNVLGSSIQSLYTSNVRKQFLELTVNSVATNIEASVMKTSDTPVTLETTSGSELKLNLTTGVSGVSATDAVMLGTPLTPVTSAVNEAAFFFKIFDASGNVRTSGFSVPITILLSSVATGDVNILKQDDTTGVYSQLLVAGVPAKATRDSAKDAGGKFAYTYVATTNSNYIVQIGPDQYISPVRLVDVSGRVGCSHQ